MMMMIIIIIIIIIIMLIIQWGEDFTATVAEQLLP